MSDTPKKILFLTMHPAFYRDKTITEVRNNRRGINLTVYNVEKDAWNHKEWDYDAEEFNQFFGSMVKLPVLGKHKGNIQYV